MRESNMPTINDIKLLQFPQLGDQRGHLVVVEGETTVPFEIKRVFYIYGSDANVVRGQHANRITDFVLINVSGTSKVRVVDGNQVQYDIHLDRPHYGIYLPHMLWKDMYDFSADSVLLVLASTHYDGSEYIRDYDEFLQIAREDGNG
jgi:dTDP-4-dehydrorhamnose 3,5-epimerase-like enzyme